VKNLHELFKTFYNFTEDKLFRHVYHPVKEMKAVPYIHSICVEKQFQHDIFLMLAHVTESQSLIVHCFSIQYV